MAAPPSAAATLLAKGLGHARNPRVILFLANFAVSKAGIYLAPLAIALLVAPSVYGAIELSQSVTLLVASFVVAPALQGLTQHFLVKGQTAYKDITWLLIGGAALTTIIATGAAAVAGAQQAVLLVCASFVGAGIHVIGNSTALMLGARNVATWTAGANILIAGALVAILLAADGEVALGALTVAYLAIAAAVLAVSAAALMRTREAALWNRLKQLSRVGLPMVLVGGLSIWLSVGGRVTVGLFNASGLPAYGVAFRVAGLLLGIHQLALTALFVPIYRGRVRRSDLIMTGFMALVLAGGIVVSLAAGPIARLFATGALDAQGGLDFVAILPLTALQTFYWIGLAMLQLRINRFGLAGTALMPTAVATLAGLGITAGVAILLSNDLELLCWMLAGHAALLFFVTAAVLRARRLPHRWMEGMGVLGGGLLALLAIALAAL